MLRSRSGRDICGGVPAPSRFGSKVLSSSSLRRISLRGTNMRHLRLRRVPPPRRRKAVHPSEGFGETRGRAVADLPCRLGDTSSGQQQSPRLTHSPRSYEGRPRASGRLFEQELELGGPHSGDRRGLLLAYAFPPSRIREFDGGKDAGSRVAFLRKSRRGGSRQASREGSSPPPRRQAGLPAQRDRRWRSQRAQRGPRGPSPRCAASRREGTRCPRWTSIRARRTRPEALPRSTRPPCGRSASRLARAL